MKLKTIDQKPNKANYWSDFWKKKADSLNLVEYQKKPIFEKGQETACTRATCTRWTGRKVQLIVCKWSKFRLFFFSLSTTENLVNAERNQIRIWVGKRLDQMMIVIVRLAMNGDEIIELLFSKTKMEKKFGKRGLLMEQHALWAGIGFSCTKSNTNIMVNFFQNGIIFELSSNEIRLEILRKNNE